MRCPLFPLSGLRRETRVQWSYSFSCWYVSIFIEVCPVRSHGVGSSLCRDPSRGESSDEGHTVSVLEAHSVHVEFTVWCKTQQSVLVTWLHLTGMAGSIQQDQVPSVCINFHRRLYCSGLAAYATRVGTLAVALLVKRSHSC